MERDAGDSRMNIHGISQEKNYYSTNKVVIRYAESKERREVAEYKTVNANS